jgi:parvulin-like peptidyl-prolyl isomerase
MRRVLAILVFLTALVGAQVVDRVVAAINDRVITQSEWEDQARFEALLEGRDPAQLRLDDESLERLIDHVLITEQLQSLKSEGVREADLKKQTAEIRKQLNAGDEEIWRTLLQKYGFTPEEFEAKIAQQINTLQLVDLRFRPNVQVSDRRVEQYYLHTYVPKLAWSSIICTPTFPSCRCKAHPQTRFRR